MGPGNEVIFSDLSSETRVIEDYYDRGRYLVAYRLSLLLVVVFSILTIAFAKNLFSEIAAYAMSTIITLSAFVYLIKTKKYRFVYYFYVITGTVLCFYTFNYLDAVLHLGDVLWMTLLVMLAFFGLGIKEGFVLLVLNTLTLIYYSILSVNINVAAMIELSFTNRVSLALEMSTALLSISYIVYQFVKFHNHSYQGIKIANNELTKSNELISAQNNENITLVKEIHHRVKNNLQIIISLLRLQKSELKSVEAEKHFAEAIDRVMVMSLIHKRLYQEKELAQINLQEYISELTSDVVSANHLQTSIETKIEVDLISIGLKSIVPLGLIINELLSNSLEHAFNGMDKGEIVIELTKAESNRFKMRYFDNGNWTEPSKKTPNFGLELLYILSEQLEGGFERTSNEHGSEFVFKLSNIDEEGLN